MNQKKLNPSEVELHESIRQRALQLIRLDTVEDMHRDGWFYWKDLANGDHSKKSSILRSLKKKLAEGILEAKKVNCNYGNTGAETLFFRFLKNDEITRAY